MAMSIKDFRQLEKCMLITTSENDAEALAGLRAANKILASNGYTWSSAFQRLVKVEDPSMPDVEDGSDTIPQDGQPKLDPEIVAAFDRLDDARLGPSSQKFINSIRDQFHERGYLTDKQKAALFNYRDNLR